MKDIIVMCPTVKRARYEFDRFCNFYDSIIQTRKLYEAKLINGLKIIFRGETEGQRVLLGTHADIVTIDEFALEFNGESKDDK